MSCRISRRRRRSTGNTDECKALGAMSVSHDLDFFDRRIQAQMHIVSR